MPIPNQRRDEVEAFEALFAEFTALEKWRRSTRGNLWRTWDGARVTIFARGDESYGWCIVSDGGKRFSRGSFESEAEAIEAAGTELRVGWDLLA